MARVTFGKILYGFTFACLLPILLAVWAAAAARNIALPPFGSAGLGVAFAAVGIGMMAIAMWHLRRFGGGLPMNAFPPPRLVKRGAFRYIPHPIYCGFVMACLGTSMAAQSPAGLWLVTPAAAAGCTALVFGYERPDLWKRFGTILRILPEDEDAPLSTIDRVRYLLFAPLPWVALYKLTTQIPALGTPFALPFEDRLPTWPWTTICYQSLYPVVIAVPWFARTRRDLRRLMIAVWLSMAVVFPLYWVMPSAAPRRPLAMGGWTAWLLNCDRVGDPPVAAFPSFHVLWSIFVARVFRPRWLGWLYAACVSVSCLTTGMHYLADIVAAALLAPVFLWPERVWPVLRRAAEWFANSWQEWRIGPVRIINHGLYAGLGAFAHVAIAMAAAGPGRGTEVLITAFSGLAGAAAWAQWVEGSSRLRRPFGFYGGLFAVAICCLFFADRWVLLAAHCLGAPWLQALGRLRCFVNGCCHGAASSPGAGIRVTEPHSRVTRLAGLAGVPIYPTQLYSIAGNLLLGVFLLHLWISACPLSLVCGVYLMGNGVARFVEEAYRGEPQTRLIAGLRFYQWLAVVSVVWGAVVSSLPASAAAQLAFTGPGLAWAAVFGLVAGAALGIDFPDVDRPLARLT